MKRLGYALAVIVIFAGFVRVAYALKVWKFGWEAETKLAERIITRLEKLPEFNVNGHYKLLQIGEQSLARQILYQKARRAAERRTAGLGILSRRPRQRRV